MKITVEFSSLEEMDKFCNGVAVASKFTDKVEVVPAEEKQEPPKKKSKQVKEAAAEPQQEASAAEETPAEETTYTLEDVRARLGALQKAGRRDDVKKLLQSFGAEKLPEVDPKDYSALMKKAGELDA